MLASDASYDDDFNNDIYNSMVQYSAVSNGYTVDRQRAYNNSPCQTFAVCLY